MITKENFIKAYNLAKSIFEPRNGYGWDMNLKHNVSTKEYGNVVSVYVWNGQVCVIADDGCIDVDFEAFSKKEQESILKESVNWLIDQPKVTQEIKNLFK